VKYTILRAGSALTCILLLLAPALWNGFPLLFHDTGSYLGRAFDPWLSPGRSAIYGFALAAGRWPNFWPVVFTQAAATVWVVTLVLRSLGLGSNAPLLVMTFSVLTTATALPWFAGQLMPDLFAGLSVLAVCLLLVRPDQLTTLERMGLIMLIAFGAASHNATLGVLIILLIVACALHLVQPLLVARIAITRIVLALMLGAGIVLTANFAVVGHVTWTPGGTAFIFGRLVQDGIINRFLIEHCAGTQFVLCEERDRLPKTVEGFLWGPPDGSFAKLGRFDDSNGEMAVIVRESLRLYPADHFRTAVKSTFQQLTMMATGDGIVDRVWTTYGEIQRHVPEAAPAAQAAHQRQGQLQFEVWNRLHIPVALTSMACLPVCIFLARRRRDNVLAGLGCTICVAILANALVCGVLSGPNDRYGARLVWISTLMLIIAVARSVLSVRESESLGQPLQTDYAKIK
jgi:hypothetical protein